jgi:hypothetical protein
MVRVGTQISDLEQSMNMKRGRMSAVPSMAVAPEPPLDTGSFVPRADSCTAAKGGVELFETS